MHYLIQNYKQMDLVDRLNFFIKSEGISPSVLADSCDIPRPTVSQLLNGRNKKISDDIIGRIHKVFPKLSILWLMFGEGEMTQKANDNSGSNSESQFSQQSNATDSNTQQASGFDSNYRDITEFMNIVSKNNSEIQAENNENPSASPTSSDNRKRITNIVVFYSDNSFQSFSPSR